MAGKLLGSVTDRQLRVTIIKPPPAPLMDGFDVRNLERNHTYDLEVRIGRYLMAAGYAIQERRSVDRAADRLGRRRSKK